MNDGETKMKNADFISKDVLLRAAQVLEITGFKNRVSLWRKSRDQDDPFPKPYKYGGHFTRWKLSEIERWMDQLETA